MSWIEKLQQSTRDVGEARNQLDRSLTAQRQMALDAYNEGHDLVDIADALHLDVLSAQSVLMAAARER